MIAWILLLIGFGMGNLQKFSFFSQDVHISALDIIVLSLTFISLFKNYKLSSRLILPIFTFFTVGLISLLMASRLYPWSSILVGSMYLVRWLAYSLFFASIIQLIKPVRIAYIIYSLGLLTVVISLGQYLVFPDIRSLVVSEWDPHYYRAVGQFLDPGFTGIILVFTLIFLTMNPFKNRLINLISWSASYLAFALTYSRSSYAAFLVSMAYISWRRKSLKFFLFIVILFITTLYALPRSSGGEGVDLERTSSIQARIDSWATAWRIYTQHPIIGAGFNVYRYAQGASLKSHAGAGADSSLLFVAATTGLVGLLAYLWYLRSLYLLSTVNYELRATLVAVLVHSMFLNSLFYPAVMVWLSLLVLSASGSPPGPSPQIPAHSPRNLNSKRY